MCIIRNGENIAVSLVRDQIYCHWCNVLSPGQFAAVLLALHTMHLKISRLFPYYLNWLCPSNLIKSFWISFFKNLRDLMNVSFLPKFHENWPVLIKVIMFIRLFIIIKQQRAITSSDIIKSIWISPAYKGSWKLTNIY